MSSVAEKTEKGSARDRRVSCVSCILALNSRRHGRVASFCRTKFAKKLDKERSALVGNRGRFEFGICNAGKAHTKRKRYLPACSEEIGL